MDRVLKPTRLQVEPDSATAADDFKHWKKTFEGYLEALTAAELQPDNLKVLTNLVSPQVYRHIIDVDTYDAAISILTELYVKQKNTVAARHQLLTCKQQIGESIDNFVVRLKRLSKECDCKAVSAEQYRLELVRDALITGIQSQTIRQRLLEESALTFDDAFKKARAMELALMDSEAYRGGTACSTKLADESDNATGDDFPNYLRATTSQRFCYYCGDGRHPRKDCPARDTICGYCQKLGHYSKVCQKRLRHRNTASISKFKSAAIQQNSSTLFASHTDINTKVLCNVRINGIQATSLMDTGSSDCFINRSFVDRHSLPIRRSSAVVTLAETSVRMPIEGQCVTNLSVQDNEYDYVTFNVLNNLSTDVIIGEKIFKQHQAVTFTFEGQRPPLTLKALPKMSVPYPKPFGHLNKDCRPMADKPRRYSKTDQSFIRSETQRLLSEELIGPSNSPWRAQVFVVTNEQSSKKRMVIDYSRTVNRFTQLDAYPLPRIEDIVNELAHHKVFSTVDLKSAYHQLELDPKDREYTAFQSGNELFQWRRLPFGLTNAVPEFQRAINYVIKTNNLKGCYPYLDDITIAGADQAEHDRNLRSFYDAASTANLTFNESKCQHSKSEISILGYRVAHNSIQPDPDRVKPLMDLPYPKTQKELRRLVGLFAYYARWISNYSDKVRPLIQSSVPLTAEAITAIDLLKDKLATVALQPINESLPFTVETDASDFAIAATLNQDGRPVAFHSRTLSQSEQRHSAVEKEAFSIVEALRKWRHLLSGGHFTLVTDQKSVSFMLDTRHTSKIKNDKIARWRLELMSYSYSVIHRPGVDNVGPDTLSRVRCNNIQISRLHDLHVSLCHPGVTRLAHFVRSKNLPYSLDEIRTVTSHCKDCQEIKPQFIRSDDVKLIKATQVFERLNIDFKGPLPSNSRNRYMLTVVDEYSRFPFAFPCPDLSAKTVIKCLMHLFSVFGVCTYVHSDRGSSFQSHELKSWLLSRGVATSRTTSYNPRGNGQCERYNGTIWTAIQCCLKSRRLPLCNWEDALTDALHSIRSLLCRATNCTPHERMFSHSRRSATGTAIPSWLKPGPIYVKRHVRNKDEPLVDEAELLEVNPNYAHVRLGDGRETTVSLRDISPRDSSEVAPPNLASPDQLMNESPTSADGDLEKAINEERPDEPPAEDTRIDEAPLRRSTRIRKPVEKYGGVPYV